MHPGAHAETTPDKPALIMAGSGEGITFKQLDDRSNQLAQLFYQRGLRPGDSIAVYMENDSRYHEVHARSLADPQGFWGEAAGEIDWIEPAKKIFDPNIGLYGRWFAGAVVNTCYNALDRHVANGRADQLAEACGLQRPEHAVERQKRGQREGEENCGLKVEPRPENRRVSERLEPE